MCVCVCVCVSACGSVCVCVCGRCGRVLFGEIVGIREESGLQQTICQPLFSLRKAIVRFVCLRAVPGHRL